MTHPDVEAQVDAYLDGELAAMDTVELEAHLAGCASCGRFRDDRLALRTAIAAQLPRTEAPEALRGRVRAAVRKAAGPGRTHRLAPPMARRWLALAASLAIVAAGSWRLATAHTASEILTDEVLASHVRSLMPGHLSDVLSTDQHTVKPWFNGKLDFSPPVHDFAGRGYPLLGGRLDYLNGRPVAALVYGRRQHLINVFLWPATGSSGGGAPLVRHGYYLLHWTTPEYTYWVASDLGLSELTTFAGLLQLGDSAAASGR
ncbi:MAG TPA: anti-sigma factor [Gemmatimonadales bacterium]|nr:anti-sigma factor [Gemmatimonadales bacterium]